MADTYIQDKSFIKRHTQYSSLYDADFLRELDQSHEKTTFARVVALNMDEDPIEQVEGRITQGSINIDGNSTVRRTCSLTMVSKDMNVNDYYWGLNTKFRLEIGLKNTVSYKGHYDQYPDIIWFKMGTYIITQINLQVSPNNFTLTLQGKDKMCLLNGDVGGVINARTDFGTYDYYDADTGITSNHKLPIKQIIWDGVHAYANEPFHNIVINDVDDLGLELLEYRYENPLYLIRDAISDEYQMITVDENFPIFIVNKNGNITSSRIKDIPVFDNLTSSMIGNEYEPTVFQLSQLDATKYSAAKVEYGQTAGYRTCELVYAGDLIADIGNTFTSVLDKIKSMLGEFEYFYDLDGRFVFQRKKALINTVWTPIHRSDDELYVESLALASNSMYDFEGSVLISSFQNSPNLLNLRNDYTVWGARKGVSGADLPIHMRYAIDNKPYRYITYETDESGHHYALASESNEAMSKREELKVFYSRTSSLEDALNNFEKDIFDDPYRTLFYQEIGKMDPQSGEKIYEDGDLWWEIWDWAEYYALAFGEYPGRKHPEDEMQFYCKDLGQSFTIQDVYSEICGSDNEYNFEPHSFDNFYLGPTNTCEVFFYHNEKGYQVELRSHGRCVHTYEEFLDAEGYVNSGFKTEHTFLLKNGNEYHFEYKNIYRDKSYWDGLRDRKGLFHYLVYAFDPRIPADILKELLNQYSAVETYVDPYANQYHIVDWRELIYRMALDYRKHNHEDGFDQKIAELNYPLYQKGTGYEQYYTDLEGFWRQLYNYPLNSKEEKTSLDYSAKFYDNLKDEDLHNEETLYIEGVYKPIGERVKSVQKEKIKSTVLSAYVYDEKEDKYYAKDNNRYYYLSNTNGFTFISVGWPKLGSDISNQDFINYCRNEKLYTRDIPNVSQLYQIKYGGFYPFLDLQDYTTGEYYQKVNADGETTYQLIRNDTKQLTLDEKSSLYFLRNSSEYEQKKLLVEEAEKDYELARANIQDSSYNDPALAAELQTAKNTLALYNQSLAELKNGGLQYVGVSNYFVGNLNDCYIYAEHEKCKIADIRSNQELRRIYGNIGAVAPQKLEKFTLNNKGEKTIYSTTISLNYYQTYTDFNGPNESNAYWNRNVFEAPYSLNFWFDFLEGDNELRQYTTQAIGDRPKAVKEDNVKSIYYRDTPKIIFSTQEKIDAEDKKTGYKYFILPESDSYSNMFIISPQGIDAKNKIDELLYQHSYCTESIQVTSVPIYYLDVNRRIHVFDENSKINGDYIVSRLSYSLTYNGMMNITATKAPENSVTEREV